MVATILYWAVVLLMAAWGAWTLVFSLINLARHENGNLWFYAILNTLGLVFAAIFYWVMSNTAWQKYWFDSTVQMGPWLGALLIAYIVLILLQVILGRERKVAAA